VVDVQEKDGAVLHVLDKPLSPGEVEGVVDWRRRFDHMQQHHGQHLLSAAFERVLEAPTTSFHLGERTCTIDLDCSISRLDEPALRSAEAAANETVWRDLPVVARDFGPEERARLPLRKEPVKGDRVVAGRGRGRLPLRRDAPGSDRRGGRHRGPRRAEVGLRKARVEFACGGRVVKLVAEQAGWLAARPKRSSARRAICPRRPGAPRTKRWRAASRPRPWRRSLRAAGGRLRRERFASRRSRRARFARPRHRRAVAERGAVALIAAVEDGRAHLCFARPRGAPAPGMNDLLKGRSKCWRKGRGSPDFAQGSGDPARLDEALAAARARVGIQ